MHVHHAVRCGKCVHNVPARHTSQPNTIFTHITHARRHPYPRSYVVFMRGVCRKTCHRARCQRRCVGPPGTQCCSQPTVTFPQGGGKERRGWEYWHDRYLPSHEGDHTPNVAPNAAIVVTYHRHVRAHTVLTYRNSPQNNISGCVMFVLPHSFIVIVVKCCAQISSRYRRNGAVSSCPGRISHSHFSGLMSRASTQPLSR